MPAVVLEERTECCAKERDALRLRRRGQQPVKPERFEASDGSRALGPTQHGSRLSSLRERLLEPERIFDRSTDPDRDHRPRHATDHLRLQLGCGGLGSLPAARPCCDERRDLTAAFPYDGAAAQCLTGRICESMPKAGGRLGMATGHLVRRRACRRRRLDVREHDRTRCGEVPTELDGPLEDHAAIGGVAGHELLETDSLEAVIRLCHHACLHLAKRGDGG